MKASKIVIGNIYKIKSFNNCKPLARLSAEKSKTERGHYGLDEEYTGQYVRINSMDVDDDFMVNIDGINGYVINANVLTPVRATRSK